MYNTYVHDTYRRIIIVIDELAEILDKKRFPKAQHARIDNIIGYLSIIACTGRAFGIHLILGTQRRSAVHLNQKQRHKKEEIRTHLPQGRISSDFLHLVRPTRFPPPGDKLLIVSDDTNIPPVGVDIFMVRPTRFAPPGDKLRTVSGNKNAHPGGVGIFMVRPTRFERATYRVGVCHSIQLSYGRISFQRGHYYSKLSAESKAKKQTSAEKHFFSEKSRSIGMERRNITGMLRRLFRRAAARLRRRCSRRR